MNSIWVYYIDLYNDEGGIILYDRGIKHNHITQKICQKIDAFVMTGAAITQPYLPSLDTTPSYDRPSNI